VPKNYIYFTSNNISAYKEGTNIEYLYKLRRSADAKIVGQTIFSTKA
jgi:hypothetical protein